MRSIANNRQPLVAHVRSWLLAILAAVALPTVAADDDFLPPEAAFKYTVTSDGTNVKVDWQVARGYYLYLKRMGIETAAPGVTLGESNYPKGEIHTDDYFGEQVVFRGKFSVTTPISGASPGAAIPLALKFQGCADAGLCYPPTTWDTSVKLPGSSSAAGAKSLDSVFAGAVSNAEEFLDPEVAFVLTPSRTSDGRIELDWNIAPGYYLYKSRIRVEPVGDASTIDAVVLPTGEPHEDEFFGEQEVYRGALQASFAAPGAVEAAQYAVTYQGCADAGLCYPTITKTIAVSATSAAILGAPGTGIAAASAAGTNNSANAACDDTTTGAGFVSEQDRLATLIRNGNLALVILMFFGFGLVLAFTPCVLPMVPILSGIIAGQGGNVSTGRAFALSVAYVLGMAVMYTGAGIAAGAIGAGFNLQAAFNQTWIVALFGGLFIVLALSMFGLFTIQMPSAIQSRLTSTSNNLRAGTFVGVGLMGALSALVVTACVAPPLIAALTVISQTGDMLRGGLTLFAMSLGMGTPLLLVGASAGKLLPRAGAWMDTVKNLFGVMLLGVAAWMFARIVPGWAGMLLWSVPALVGAWILIRAAMRTNTARFTARAAATAAGLYGVALLAGAALGGTDPLAPIPQLAAPREHLTFKRIKTLADLEREVAAASAANRAVMLDFYADWCVSCKEMEKYTFTAKPVHEALGNAVLLQADVTANDKDDQALLANFCIFGPPSIAFYGPDGRERRNFRVVGYMKAKQFASVVAQATAADSPLAANN